MPKKLTISKWDKYWKLTILKEVTQIWTRRRFKCKCECWNTKDISLNSIRGWTISCWCYKDKIFKDMIYKDWRTWTTLYNIYKWILQRCNNINKTEYKYYGWRWIECEWKLFEEFKEDMWYSYKKWLTIDRINVDGNYSKENCRWVTMKEQNCNKRNTVYLEYMWKKLTMKWRADKLWIKYLTIRNRYYNYDMPVKDILKTK